MIAALSQGTLQRLPQYLIMLKSEAQEGHTAVTADEIGQVVKVSPSQVRHDLSSCGVNRAPGEQYDVKELMAQIEHALGYDDISNAVIVGAGQLGRALLSYTNYSEYGVDVIAAFDADESLVGREVNGRPILSIKRMSSLCRRMKVHIGIITVPVEHAQEACDALVAGGVLGIWNFAPAYLRVPDNILLQNENMAASLALLSKHLREKFAEESER